MDLVLWDEYSKSLNVIKNYGKDNQLVTLAGFALSNITKNSLTFERNNRELHIGVGHGENVNSPLWLGYITNNSLAYN